MIAALLALAAAAQGSKEPNFVEQLMLRADAAGRNSTNGYSDYLYAAALSLKLRDPDRLVKLQEASRAFDPGVKPLSPDQLALYRRYLNSHEGPLTFVRSGNAKPVWNPSPSFTFATLSPEASEFKTLGRILALGARLRFRDGDVKGGTDALLEGLVFARKSAFGDHLHALVSDATERLLLRAAVENSDRLSPADLDRLDAWAKEALAGGTIFARASAVQLGSYRNSFLSFTDRPEPWLGDDKEEQARAKMIREGFAKLTPAQRDTLYNFVLARLERPTAALVKRLTEPEAKWTQPLEIATGDNFPAPDFVSPEGVTAGVFQYLRIYRVMQPSEDEEKYAADIAAVAARQRIRQRLFRLHLAVHRYHRLQGQFPKSLAALPEGDLPNVDPITGTPYTYEVAGIDFRLWNESKALGKVTFVEEPRRLG